MKTKYIEIESIILEDNYATIAAEVVLDGFNYSEPAYTNIFSTKAQLLELLTEEPSEISSNLRLSIKDRAPGQGSIVQYDLADYNGNKSWKPGITLTLEPVDSSPYGFACYELITFEINQTNYICTR